MKVTFLGTGTSQGIPVIGCSCDTCRSIDPRDNRQRCSIYVDHPDFSFIVDAGPDFRSQVLKNKINKIDFLLLTHEHNDHTAGLDDIRPFNYIQRKPLAVYSINRVLNDVKKRFAYAFDENPYPGSPQIELKMVEFFHNIQINQNSSPIIPIKVKHGKIDVLGFRLDNFAYLTDMLYIEESEMEKLQNLEVAIISMLHREAHHAHMNWEQAIRFAEELNAKKTYLIHMSHRMGPLKNWEKELPRNVFAAYDGLTLNI